MTNDDTNETHMTSEDIDALRILMHNVKGLSVVSDSPSVYREAPDE